MNAQQFRSLIRSQLVKVSVQAMTKTEEEITIYLEETALRVVSDLTFLSLGSPSPEEFIEEGLDHYMEMLDHYLDLTRPLLSGIKEQGSDQTLLDLTEEIRRRSN